MTALVTGVTATNPVNNDTTSATLTVDTIAPTFTAVAPAPSAYINSATVSYTLNKPIASGTITISQTGGIPTDGASPHICTLTGTALNSGAHTNAALSSACSSAPTLVNGVIYSFAFDGTDVAGNAASEVLISM